MPKTLLVISRQAPWSGLNAKEALDIVLAGGAFDFPIGLLFMDDGVFQLESNQKGVAVQQKNLIANLQALPLFGVENLFACSHSLSVRGIASLGLAIDNAQLLTAEEICTLIDHYDQVITL